ncbi:hypothetical protein FAUST_2226 [Fusarium austroamericanum]|uniref:Hydrophobin n=1 Tax=Fusarium austroamericanum TaxID=282268 RepID=A0AAN6C777_FUSAU|nr:hypothetical protein FAUST_2226 [Fusarium austroamericanum]
MKASLILVLPALAIAAATPPTVEPRQLPLPLNTECLRKITGITDCLTNIGTVTGNPFNIGDIFACATKLPTDVVNALVTAATKCIRLPVPLPVKE